MICTEGHAAADCGPPLRRSPGAGPLGRRRSGLSEPRRRTNGEMRLLQRDRVFRPRLLLHSTVVNLTMRAERETRWRWRLKVFSTATCMLRNRWAQRADLTAPFCVLVVVPADANFRLDILSQPLLMRAGQPQMPSIRRVKGYIYPGFPHSLHRGRRPCVPILFVTK